LVEAETCLYGRVDYMSECDVEQLDGQRKGDPRSEPGSEPTDGLLPESTPSVREDNVRRWIVVFEFSPEGGAESTAIGPPYLRCAEKLVEHWRCLVRGSVELPIESFDPASQ